MAVGEGGDVGIVVEGGVIGEVVDSERLAVLGYEFLTQDAGVGFVLDDDEGARLYL